METELTVAELKNKALTTRAVDLMMTHPAWSNQQIADELDISRTTLWNLTKGQEAQELMRRELNEIETTLHRWIQELYNSPSPANQRTATKLLHDTATKLADKLRPTLTRTENLNINIELNQIHQTEIRLQQTLNQLPPTMRTAFWEVWNNTQPQ